MKRCPQCNRVETDEALKFCRVDGTTLINDSSSVGSETGTADLSSTPNADEVHTSILPQNTSANVSRATGPTTALPPPPPASTTSELNKPKQRRTLIIITVIATAVVAVTSALLVNSYRSKTSSGAIQSIAVMPFVNESGNAEFEYLSDGMTETLINSLSQLSNLSVKARSTVFHYKGKDTTPQQVGTELSVQAVLNGRVTQHADQLTLSLELVDARTGDQIWGDQYIRKTNDLVTLQNQVARDVANSLRTKLSTINEQKLTKKYTDNPEAYRLYLQGVFYWNQLNSPKAVECFQQAITIDPNYALAYSGLGDAYVLRLVGTGAQQPANTNEVLSKARQAAERALQLDKDLPDAHALMSILLWIQDYDFAGFEHEINRAIELNPNYSEGHRRNGLRLFYLGQFDAALVEYRKALDLDPLSNLNNYNYAQTFVCAGRYDEAEAQIQKNLRMDPGFVLFHVQLSTLYRLKGNYAGAVEESAKASEQQNHPESARLRRESFAKGGWQGYLRALVTELEQSKSNPYTLATAYAELGEKDKAFAALEDVYNAHSNFVGYFKIDPLLIPLRDDPRFKALLKKSGFTG